MSNYCPKTFNDTGNRRQIFAQNSDAAHVNLSPGWTEKMPADTGACSSAKA